MTPARLRFPGARRSRPPDAIAGGHGTERSRALLGARRCRNYDAVMAAYPTLPVPERIRVLKEELLSTPTKQCLERARIVTDSYRNSEGEPWVIRRALALKATFEQMPIVLRDGELLVGQRAEVLAGRSAYPEYNLGGLTDTAAPEIVEYWIGRTLADESHDGAPILHRRHQLTVVDVENLTLDAEDLGAALDLRRAPLRERPTGHAPVADVAVGHRHELHVVA